MTDAPEVVAEVAEEVAQQATHVAEVSRGLSGRGLALALGGFIVGSGVGGAIGYILAQRKLETKYAAFAASEIAEMREHYNRKFVAREEKGDLEEIVQERGYSAPESTRPPMAVTPPASVVEASEIDEDEDDEIMVETEVVEQNVFRDVPQQEADGWDWHKERSRRSPHNPYVVHRDEIEEFDHYARTTLTYFDGDDVLCNEIDEILDQADRDRLIGEANLNKFGHGSGDDTLVYIRNDALETVFDVNLSERSYAQEVKGFDPPEDAELRHSHRRRERAFDDE